MTVTKHTDRDIILHAFTFFQDASEGAGLQMERIQQNPANNAKTTSHLWHDWQTLVTHLWRMRKAALLLGNAKIANAKVQKAVAAFDKVLPSLKTYRDVFEHMDEYVFENDKRHYKHIGSSWLQTGAVSNDYYAWSIIDDVGMFLPKVADASSELYHSIKAIRDEVRGIAASDQS
ncbi:MAG TPA: hypothetical protein VJ836_06385 [Candidatus Saccharimonadales bacterium]|nr:hypothetical protein [Candidatus Saccharimonadales bacterium]